MKLLILVLCLSASQSWAGELLMDCHFGRELKTLSLAALDFQDGGCRSGVVNFKEGPVKIQYQIELCHHDAKGSVNVMKENEWIQIEEFSTAKNCILRRKIETAPGRCIPARSRC